MRGKSERVVHVCFSEPLSLFSSSPPPKLQTPLPPSIPPETPPFLSPFLPSHSPPHHNSKIIFSWPHLCYYYFLLLHRTGELGHSLPQFFFLFSFFSRLFPFRFLETFFFLFFFLFFLSLSSFFFFLFLPIDFSLLNDFPFTSFSHFWLLFLFLVSPLFQKEILMLSFLSSSHPFLYLPFPFCDCTLLSLCPSILDDLVFFALFLF